MTTLILGAGGMLGRALAATFPEARPLVRRDLDVTEAGAVRAALAPGTALVLNAAAYTKVDLAETDPEHERVNGDAVGLLAARCREIGARLVHVSTDYVFPGTPGAAWREGDAVAPLNAYGRGKLAGERAAFASGADVLVVRTSWLFGAGGPNFVDSILAQAEGGRIALDVVADQTGRPTGAGDLADAIRRLVAAGAKGVVHFANAGAVTWRDLAAAALAAAGRRGVVVRPRATAEHPRPAARPAWSVLDTSLYEAITGSKPRPFEAPLAEYVRARAARRVDVPGVGP